MDSASAIARPAPDGARFRPGMHRRPPAPATKTGRLPEDRTHGRTNIRSIDIPRRIRYTASMC
ncbi:MAG: hypothetical protein HSCHL_1681 [Hydrogenibacillus schlegelii]|uniref:Uncharacterized protein n=1 Tax=Hydrogenibacillus schlegelii TaxID=1484 RepID=A0A2T5GBS3_HYDSH|nr:MAG: hypothetical protein HSCHL_1681 [Hydrogenibacillus schlegelii]